MSEISMELVQFDEKGLVPVIVQDVVSAEVLMVAWANAEALQLTAKSGVMTLWSRSRSKLWRKGETSGNSMEVIEMRIDCDGDSILALVKPTGPACHTGERTCFYRTLSGETSAMEATFLGRLWRYLNKRKNDNPEESYTARLISEGASRVAQKVGEEGVETAVAVATLDKEGFRYEAADLLYHLLVACVSIDVPLSSVLKELAERHKNT